MRAPMSVVLATKNAGGVLPVQLAALGEGLREGLIRELIVIDHGSADDTLAIAEEAGAEIRRFSGTRAMALRQGGDIACGEWLLFGAAGTALSEGWSTQMLRHLERRPDKTGAMPVFRIGPTGWSTRFRSPERWLLVPQRRLYLAGPPERGLDKRMTGRTVRW